MARSGQGTIDQIALYKPDPNERPSAQQSVFLMWISDNGKEVVRGDCGIESKLRSGQRQLPRLSSDNCQSNLQQVPKTLFTKTLNELTARRLDPEIIASKQRALAETEAHLRRHVQELERQAVATQVPSARKLTEANLAQRKKQLAEFLESTVEEMDSLEREGLEQKPARVIASRALDLLAEPFPISLLGYTLAARTKAPQVLQEILWQAFEASRTMLQIVRTPSDALRALPLTGFMTSGTIQLDLSTIAFTIASLKSENDETGLFFTPRGMFASAGAAADDLISAIKKQGPEAQKIPRLDPVFGEPICKIWVPIPDLETKVIKEAVLIRGTYSSLPELQPQVGLTAFELQGENTDDSVAEIFFTTCGFVGEPAYAGNGHLSLLEQRPQEESQSFTVGDFFSLFQRNALKLEFKQ